MLLKLLYALAALLNHIWYDTTSCPGTAVYIETMKSLGYPRPISLDNFRTPNFELVADCLQWLIHR